MSAAPADASQQTREADGYPGIDGHTAQTTRSRVAAGGPSRSASPAGGAPAVITACPGWAASRSRFDQALGEPSRARPAQTALFISPTLTHELLDRRRTAGARP